MFGVLFWPCVLYVFRSEKEVHYPVVAFGNFEFFGRTPGPQID